MNARGCIIEDEYIEMYTHHVFTKDTVTIYELKMRQGRLSCRMHSTMYGYGYDIFKQKLKYLTERKKQTKVQVCHYESKLLLIM